MDDRPAPRFTTEHKIAWQGIYRAYGADLSEAMRREYAQDTAHIDADTLVKAMVRYRKLPLLHGEHPRPPIPAEVLELVI